MAPSIAQRAARLDGLRPTADSLIALAGTNHADLWRRIRLDPACVLLVLRACPKLAEEGGTVTADLLDAALAISEPATPTDWSRPGLRPLYQASVNLADYAHRIALRSGACHPETAWAAGLMAPLGWYALAAVSPTNVAARDSGFDPSALARRLARRWELPGWLTAVVGWLRLPIPAAADLGADPDLFAVVRLAAEFAETDYPSLGLTRGTDHGEAARHLGLRREQLRSLPEGLFRQESVSSPTPRWQPAGDVSLIEELLLARRDLLRRDEAEHAETLEDQADRLIDALADRHASEESRLRDRKLNALAEFAAGASHEINNPLAVIAGQAQSLLHAEGDPKREESLRSIIRQTGRIHQILLELMQFARPSTPRQRPGDLRDAILAVLESQQPAADAKRVRLSFAAPDHPAPVFADFKQVRTAINCLVRNAIEAAPEDGWATVTLACPGDQAVVRVEDNGPGPPSAKAAHIFDPFFSGRDAGRGRGLGLPTAWRLARLQGGDVRHDPTPGGPTRFVMTVPLVADLSDRRCA